MIYASYHSRLEMAFCMDEFLKPPIKEDIDFVLEQKEPTRNSTEMKEQGETNVVGRTKKTLQMMKDSNNVVNSKSVNAPLNSDAKELASAMNKKELSSAIDTNTAVIDNPIRDIVRKDVDVECANCDNSRKSKVSDLSDDAKRSSRPGDNESVLGNKTVLTQSEKDPKSERSSSFINFEAKCDEKTESNDKLGEDSGNSKVIFELEDQVAESDDQAKQAPVSDPVIECTRSIEKEQVDLNKKTQEKQELIPVLRKQHHSGGKRDKSPGGRQMSMATQLTDHSDPLHSYQMNHDDSIFQSSVLFQEQLVTHR